MTKGGFRRLLSSLTLYFYFTKLDGFTTPRLGKFYCGWNEYFGGVWGGLGA
jgi:hypothetical protein